MQNVQCGNSHLILHFALNILHFAFVLFAAMTDRSFVFGVDLDGVVADFYGGLRPIAAEWLGVNVDTLPQRVSWGLVEWGVAEAPGGYERLHRFAVTQPRFTWSLPCVVQPSPISGMRVCRLQDQVCTDKARMVAG